MEKKQPHLIMMIGAPASGKSTWIREFTAQHADENWLHLDEDAITEAYCGEVGESYHEIHQGPDQAMHRKAFHDRYLEVIGTALAEGRNIICDRNNHTAEIRREVLALAEQSGHDYYKEAVYFPIDYATAKVRAENRSAQREAEGLDPRPIPDHVLEKRIADIEANLPTDAEGYDAPMRVIDTRKPVASVCEAQPVSKEKEGQKR